MKTKKIVFLTGTRADFGKLKSLIAITSQEINFEVHIFATGMHLLEKYGYTVLEIEHQGFKNIYKYANYTSEETMDRTLSKTIDGFSKYIEELNPDLIVVHGDRVETLAGAIVGALNNILVAHIEGGELSGTIDELIRHAVTKLCHIHFVSNEFAKKRLIQMGENENTIFVIGSPDVDLILSDKLPKIKDVKNRYDIPFKKYSILLFHPVTSEIINLKKYAEELVDAILESKYNYVVVFPNNDLGSNIILDEYKRLAGADVCRIFPSIRFEYFLVLMKHSSFMIGNSSAGIREAPYYGIPVVNIGTRQLNRSLHQDIINCGYSKKEILDSIKATKNIKRDSVELFGTGNSDKLFIRYLSTQTLWETNKQKIFYDILNNP